MKQDEQKKLESMKILFVGMDVVRGIGVLLILLIFGLIGAPGHHDGPGWRDYATIVGFMGKEAPPKAIPSAPEADDRTADVLGTPDVHTPETTDEGEPR